MNRKRIAEYCGYLFGCELWSYVFFILLEGIFKIRF
jgi:hypothetical protein